MPKINNSIFLFIILSLVSGCAANPTKQLEREAKDWCLTIRASQVLPVYPLSEDIQPGDVFIVQKPLAQQTELYEKKGFLPLDQRVTRLNNLDYSKFYSDSYWAGDYSKTPHERPGSAIHSGVSTIVAAPRVAFPSYNFSIQRGEGLKLALPIEGIPLGLGLMGASQATGTVTLKDAYTYGIDCEDLARALYTWWKKSPDRRYMMMAIPKGEENPIYLRAVSRVYLVKSIDVSLTNLDIVGAGADVGLAPKLELPDLSKLKPHEVESSVSAYQKVLELLSGQLNNSAVETSVNKSAVEIPGAAVRFNQASQRSVSMTQTFDRPLVFGYRGFDVQVYEDGTLSAPIPSFSVVSGSITKNDFLHPVAWNPNELSKHYLEWLKKNNNFKSIKAWLKKLKIEISPSDLYYNKNYRFLLYHASKQFNF